MQLRKIVIALLALLVAAMVMVPIVSADEQNAIVSTISTWKYPVPEHYIPPDYFKDAKPATPLPESEMINLVFSEQSLDSFNKEK